MDINDLWNWALDTNATMNENDESEDMIMEIADVLEEYGIILTDAFFMEDGVVLKWI